VLKLGRVGEVLEDFQDIFYFIQMIIV